MSDDRSLEAWAEIIMPKKNRCLIHGVVMIKPQPVVTKDFVTGELTTTPGGAPYCSVCLTEKGQKDDG